MDSISAVLSLLKPKNHMFRGLVVGGAWSLNFPATQSVRCYALLSGDCWLVVDSVADPIRLTRGDCFLLTRRQSFRLASDPNEPSVEMAALLSHTLEGGVLTYNGGGDVSGLGGFFEFEGPQAGMLLSRLPAVVHVRNASSKASLIASMQLMMQELREPQAGALLVAQHLAQMMLVLAVRTALAEAPNEGLGWISALADRQLGAAMNAIHDDPRQPWTLISLARLANMSRSAFAVKFKETVGTTPMEYLQRWRMMLAVDKLMNSNDPISVIGMSVGYESDSSFSTAFKRVMGCSPGRYSSMRSGEVVGSVG